MPAGAWPALVLLTAVVISLDLLSELGFGYVLKRSAIALPFLLAAFPVLFTVGGEPLFSVTIGPWTLTATVQGLERFASIAWKSWLSVQVAILLTATTPFPSLLQAMRSVRIPAVLVAIIALMWRYTFVLADEAKRLMRARDARSGDASRPGLRSGGTLRWRAAVTGGMAGSLFLRSYERAERVHSAMVSRGYDGEIRSLPQPPLSPALRRLTAVALVLMTVFVLIVYLV
jgi:cobalt/nickel transport system permease protein